jgi:hypothetical protein
MRIILNFKTFKMGKKKQPAIIEIHGNNGGNYVKVGKVADGDNRIFLEIGDCCVVTFRGILTAEMLSNFLTNVSLNANKPLIEVIKENMTWDKAVNEKFCVGSKTMSWSDAI